MNSDQESSNAHLLKLAAAASVTTATVLIGAKFIAWLYTGSVSVLASLIDSLMDIAASLINLFAVRYSLMPADDDHRFGHGKAEQLAGLAQATFIAGSALFLIFHAIDRLKHPQPLEDISVGVTVMIISIIATLVLLKFQHHVIKKTGSTAIKADALHYVTDLLTNLSIIVALILTVYGWGSADAWFAIAIAVYIFYSAWKIAYESFHLLMDRELPTEIKEQIVNLAQNHPLVHGTHDLRTRQSGQTKFIQLHIELDARLSFVEAHNIADELEKAIEKAVPNSQVMIHQDPVVLTHPFNPQEAHHEKN